MGRFDMVTRIIRETYMDEFWTAAVALGILFICVWPSLEKTENINIYYQYCSNWDYNPWSCKDDIYNNKMEFKVSFKRQMVIKKGVFMEYSKCIVFDKDNWQCTFDKNRFVVLNDGNYLEAGGDGSLNRTIGKDGKLEYIRNFKQTNWLIYYYNYLKGFFRG